MSLAEGRRAAPPAAASPGASRRGAGRFEPVFVAARDEFEQYPLRSFAARLCRLLERAGSGAGEVQGPGEGDLDVDAWFARGRLEPLGAAGGKFYVLRPEDGGSRGDDAPQLLVLLSRLPLPAEQIAALAARAGAVVAAGRPWDAAPVPETIPVITTFGIFDEAAAAVARILHGLRGG